jgi:glucose-6-phosphate isomerase
VVWGAPGTDGQHAFFQYLHQGTGSVPCDLIGFMRPGHDTGGTHHDMLVANLLAQAEALAVGRTPEEAEAEGTPPELVPHRTMPGNRPSTLILAPELSPSVLGQLIALYEHRTVVAAALWGINPFDQWGVELGKTLARHFGRWLETEPAGDGTPDPGAHEGSTSDLIGYYRRLWDRGDG